MVTKLSLPTIYWINLDRSPGRRARMQGSLAEYGLAAVRVPAVDGQLPVVPFIRCCAENPLVAACLASHLTAIRMAYTAGEEQAVFMEDDASFELLSRWPGNLNAVIASLPPRWSALWLGYGDTPRHLDELFLRDGMALPVERLSLWSTVAYLLHRRAMQHILELYDRAGCFDVLGFEGAHEADTLLLQTLSSSKQLDGPHVLRVPMFLYDGADSEIHRADLTRQRRARRFILEAFDALVAGGYVSRFPLRARMRAVARAARAPFRRVREARPRASGES